MCMHAVRMQQHTHTYENTTNCFLLLVAHTAYVACDILMFHSMAQSVSLLSLTLAARVCISTKYLSAYIEHKQSCQCFCHFMSNSSTENNF